MGFIKAGVGALGGVLADTWKEFFSCDALEGNVLAAKAVKQTSRRSSNTKGSDNVITDGSKVVVADGQCALVVAQGKVVEVLAEPGEFIYHNDLAPTIFAGSLGESVKQCFSEMAQRFTYGGQAAVDQRLYYFNTKEVVGQKYGTANPVPFRVVDERAGIDIDVRIRCSGEYSIKLTNPLLFYTNVCGNVDDTYTLNTLNSQMRSELLTALQPAFGKLSAQGVRYSEVTMHTMELADTLNDLLSKKWRDLRGMEIASFGVSTMVAMEEDEQMLREMQRNAAFMDPTRAAAYMVGAQGAAMQAAAANQGGAAVGFMGMNMAGMAGGMNAQSLYQMGQAQPQPQAQPQDSWSCSCGAVVRGNFCPNCGTKKPAPQAGNWVCSCGTSNTGKFCTECGKPRP